MTDDISYVHYVHAKFGNKLFIIIYRKNQLKSTTKAWLNPYGI